MSLKGILGIDLKHLIPKLAFVWQPITSRDTLTQN